MQCAEWTYHTVNRGNDGYSPVNDRYLLIGVRRLAICEDQEIADEIQLKYGNTSATVRGKKWDHKLTMKMMNWYPATAANAAKGELTASEMQYANNAAAIPYNTMMNHCIPTVRSVDSKAMRYAYKESETCEIIWSNGSKDDGDNRRKDDNSDHVEHQMTQPQANRIRKAVRHLHRLHRGLPFPRNIEGIEGGVYGLHGGEQ